MSLKLDTNKTKSFLTLFRFKCFNGLSVSEIILLGFFLRWIHLTVALSYVHVYKYDIVQIKNLQKTGCLVCRISWEKQRYFLQCTSVKVAYFSLIVFFFYFRKRSVWPTTVSIYRKLTNIRPRLAKLSRKCKQKNIEQYRIDNKCTYTQVFRRKINFVEENS